MAKGNFAPMVHDRVSGATYTPDGWMWVMAFAIGGCEWAIKEASKPEFKERVLQLLKDQQKEYLRSAIERKLDEIEALRKELRVAHG